MADNGLLVIRSAFVVIEINGPTYPRRGIVSGPGASPARLGLTATRGTLSVTWADTDGARHLWTGKYGPSFFEDTSYRFRAKALLQGSVPVPVYRDPSLFQSVDYFSDDGECVGTFNFHRQVGLSTLEVRVGHESLRITLEVFPVKIDYALDYAALLSEVSSVARGLALAYMRATFRFGRSFEVEQPSNIEWLTILQNEIKVLDRAVNHINEHPQRQLARSLDSRTIETIRHVDASVRRAVSRRIGYGPFIDVAGAGKVRSRIPASSGRESLDTLENRWLKQNLLVIGSKLSDLAGYVSEEAAEHRRSARPVPKRLTAEIAELTRLINVIRRLLDLPMFADVGDAVLPNLSTLTLLQGIGYGDAYRAIMALRQGLTPVDGPYEIVTKDIHELYEIWCYLELVRIVTSSLSLRVDLADIVNVKEEGIRVRLRRGEASVIRTGDGSRSIDFLYSPEFPGLTGNQRPDIVIRTKYADWPELIIVCDAKYRLDGSSEYVRRYRTPGPPQDAINALHRYRDAIVVESEQRGLERPVVRGAALFPLALSDAQHFEQSPLHQALNVLGIGALPFLPSNTKLVAEWIVGILSLPAADLAIPGPPFSGVRERHQRGMG